MVTHTGQCYLTCALGRADHVGLGHIVPQRRHSDDPADGVGVHGAEHLVQVLHREAAGQATGMIVACYHSSTDSSLNGQHAAALREDHICGLHI